MKKTLALLLALALVFSSITVAFAEETISADAKAVSSLGMLVGSGDGVTSAYLATTPNRIQAAIMVLRLKGQEEAAKAFTGVDNFADAKDAAWAAPIMAYLKAHPEVGFGGIGNDKFNPNGLMDVKSYYKVMLETLGYKQNTTDVIGDFTYPNVLSFAAEKGLKAVATVTNFTVNDLATATIETLKATVAGGTKTLATSLVESKVLDAAKAQAAGVYAIVPATLAVESITVTNLREMVVKFNRAPIADTAKKAENYTINGDTPEAATVSADGLTVTLRLADTDKMGNYSTDNKLVILKAVGFAADTKVESIVAKDTAVPTMASVEATGPRTIKVTFSEPLSPGTDANTVNSFKVDNATVALDTTTATFSGRVLTLKTLADLSTGSHTVEIKNDSNNLLVDGAGYKVVPTSLSFTYAKDTNPLTVSVDSSNETSVTVKFNKPIDLTTLTNNTNLLISHTYNTDTNRVGWAALHNEGDDQTFTINFGTSKPLPPGNTNLFISYSSSTGTKLADGYGNKLAETTLTVTTVADVVKPVVEKVEFKSATQLEVTFSENVRSATAENKANYTLKDSAGDAITVTNAAFKVDSTKIVVLTTNTMNGGSYTLAVKNVTDVSIAQNKLDDVTIAFSATDKVPPTIVDKMDVPTGIQVSQIGDKKVKISFSETMDVATLTDKANYKHNNSPLATDDKVEAADNNKAVVITFVNTLPTADTGVSGVLDVESITVARLKDAAGNWMESFSTNVQIAKLAPLTPYSIQMVAKNQFKLRFKGEVVSGAAVADFQVAYDGSNFTAVPVTGISTSVVDGDTYITLTTATAPLTAGIVETVGTAIRVRTTNGASTTGAKNAYGNTLAFVATPVTDKCAPEIVSVTTGDNDNDNKLDRIFIRYSEGLYAASVQDSDYTVEGYEITAVALSTDLVTITVKEKDIEDATATPKVTQVGDVEDAGRNKLGAQEAVTAVDAIMNDVPVAAKFVLVDETGASANDGHINLTAAGGFTTFEAVKIQYIVVANNAAAPAANATQAATTATATATYANSAALFSNVDADGTNNDVYVRFIDGANNASGWVKITN